MPRPMLFRLGVATAIGVAILDQLVKWLMLAVVMAPPRVIEVTGFFNLVLVANRGVSFGLLASDSPWGQPLLSGLALLISIFLLVWLRRAENRLLALSLGLVLGGAIGNTIDRLTRGAVVDYLDFYYRNYHWPSFNLADTAITVGVALIFIEGLFAERSRNK